MDKPSLRDPEGMDFPQPLQEDRPDFAYSATRDGEGTICKVENDRRATMKCKARRIGEAEGTIERIRASTKRNELGIREGEDRRREGWASSSKVAY